MANENGPAGMVMPEALTAPARYERDNRYLEMTVAPDEEAEVLRPSFQPVRKWLERDELFTPRRAQKLLERRIPGNRMINDAMVQRYIGEARKGLFRESVIDLYTVVGDPEPWLSGGQHRMAMLVSGRFAYHFDVMYSEFSTMEQARWVYAMSNRGREATFGDTLRLYAMDQHLGVPHREEMRAIGAAALLISGFRYTSKEFKAGSKLADFDHDTRLRWLERWKEPIQAANKIVDAGPASYREAVLRPPSLAVMLATLAGKGSQEAAHAFWGEVLRSDEMSLRQDDVRRKASKLILDGRKLRRITASDNIEDAYRLAGLFNRYYREYRRAGGPLGETPVLLQRGLQGRTLKDPIQILGTPFGNRSYVWDSEALGASAKKVA